MDLQLNSLNMKLQPCTFEQAKALKELGFPQETDSWNYYDIEGKCVPYLQKGNHKEKCCEAPSLELVAKWLRKIKHMDIMIVPLCLDFNEGSKTNFETPDAYEARLIKNGQEIYVTYYCNSYEEALSAGIDKAIEMLKQQ